MPATLDSAEIATNYGALDSTAFETDMAYSAHVLRAMGMSANRLTTKGQTLCNLVWPVTSVGETSVGCCVGIAPADWTLIVPPILVLKRGGLSLADIRLRVLVSTSHVVYFQACSRAKPLYPEAIDTDPGMLKVTGDGSFADQSIDGLPLDRDATTEVLSLWCKGEPTGTAGSEATYGANNDGIVHACTEDTMLTLSSESWNTVAGTETYATGGHYLDIYDTTRSIMIAGSRTITGLVVDPGFAQIHVWPGYSQDERIRSFGKHWYIRKLPQWQLANFAAAAVARTS